KPEQYSRFEKKSAEILEKLIDQYAKTLRKVLNHQPFVLFIFFLSLGVTLFLVFMIPKGFFPVQDTGIVQAITEGPQSVSFDRMSKLQQSMATVVLEDPAVLNLSSFIGVDGTNTSLNRGRFLIALKPFSERSDSAETVIKRLQSKINHLPDSKIYLQ